MTVLILLLFLVIVREQTSIKYSSKLFPNYLKFTRIQVQMANNFHSKNPEYYGIDLLIKMMTVLFACSSPIYPAIADEGISAVKGRVQVDGEVSRIYQKALQTQSDGDLDVALQLYQQVVQVQPDYIDAWSNLGNVLTSKGFLDQALLCYRKALSLSPPRDEVWVILLNKGAVELAKGEYSAALGDLKLAESIGGSQPSILTSQAVVYTMQGDWYKGCGMFERVISSSDRNALPWWLRYSMSLLETGRGTEAVAYLQRTLNRFSDESECRAFAASLYTAIGNPTEAKRYWDQIPTEDKDRYRTADYIENTLKWGPKSVEYFYKFLKLEGQVS